MEEEEFIVMIPQYHHNHTTMALSIHQ